MASHGQQENHLSPSQRCTLLKNFPCFMQLNSFELEALAKLMQEVTYLPDATIVMEDDIVDSIYIIASGDAEVSRQVKHGRKIKQVPMAILRHGEAIGLNDTGFYSSTGKRTATVTALTKMVLLRIDIKDLYAFLKHFNLENAMFSASLQMLRMRLIKQSLPFSKLSHERLMWLANHVKEVVFQQGQLIFQQGMLGEACYLIRSGSVEIYTQAEDHTEKQIAVLKPPTLFGEASLLMQTTRNASARALTDCELLSLDLSYLSELIESEQNVAHMFMTLSVDRSRPLKNPQVTVHHRETADGQEVTILKNTSGAYFKLSAEGKFIWENLNGKKTLQDLTLAVADQFNVFAPDVVAALISKLSQAGFIENLTLTTQGYQPPALIKNILKLRKLFEFRFAFGDADAALTRIYNRYLCYLFTKPGQIILALLSIVGFIAFIVNTPNIVLFFSYRHASLWLLLTLIPLGLIAAVLHELAHAFAVKAMGREVHYIGVGWFWLSPFAFTDTSDMWLSQRGPRMLVNFAGIYMDILIAGIGALFMMLFSNPYIQCMLWLFVFYTYIGAVRMLSPLQELDGYFILMDWLEKPHLRQSAVLWLIKKFPQCLRHPSCFRENWPELSYWLACLMFLVVIVILTYIIQAFIFDIFGYQMANPYYSLILPILVAIVSCASIIAEIRQAAD